MQLIRGFDALEQCRLPRVVATVGSYDGLHKAHRALVERCIAEAHSRNCASMVITFEPHPRITLGRDEGLSLLTTLDEKAYLLSQWGIDYLFVIDFDEAFSHISQEEFLAEYLHKRLGVECLVMGYNHRFGHDADMQPSVATAADSLVDIVRIDQQFVGERKVSSTVVRRTLAAGDMALARELLGHRYIIIGMVEGSTLMVHNRYKLLPSAGRYSAYIDGEPIEIVVEQSQIRLANDSFNQRKIVIEL